MRTTIVVFLPADTSRLSQSECSKNVWTLIARILSNSHTGMAALGADTHIDAASSLGNSAV